MLNVKVSTDVIADLHEFFTVRYSIKPAENIIHQLPTIAIPSLQHEQMFESWKGLVNHSERTDDWQIYLNEQYLMARVPDAITAYAPIDQASEQAYQAIFEIMQAHEYPYLIRTWNYFPEITQDIYPNSNNYQLFCSGRTRAYQNNAVNDQSYPAATVIGSQLPEMQIFFIAARKPGIGIENTLQVSAFEYPPIYSKDPPLFSRALLHRNNQQEILFVSGTASITGHNTQFEGDINRQTELCLSNIEQLVSTAVSEHQMTSISLQDFSQFKVYIKNPEHLDTVRTHIQLRLGHSAAVYYLQGDMCRTDLSVEIEALAIIPITRLV